MFDLTVIVPSHNKGAYIEQCIESIFNQTFRAKEVIVFDDRSTDDTLDILERLKSKHPNLTVIASDKNVGVSEARNSAIHRSSSDYVTFIDADDFYFSPKKLEAEMMTAEEYYRAKGHLCCAYSQTVLVDKEGNRLDRQKIRDWDKHVRFGTTTRLYKYWVPRDYCVPRDIFIEVGEFNRGMSLYEDWDLNLRLLRKTDFVFSNDYGTAYRLDTGGLASVDFRKHYAIKRQVFNSNKKQLRYSISEIIIFNLLMKCTYTKGLVREALQKLISGNMKHNENEEYKMVNESQLTPEDHPGNNSGGYRI